VSLLPQFDSERGERADAVLHEVDVPLDMSPNGFSPSKTFPYVSIPSLSLTRDLPRLTSRTTEQHTINGKKVEVPIKKLLSGATLDSINSSTLSNPECLVEFVELGKMLRAEVE
jgi:hypothetical protein